MTHHVACVVAMLLIATLPVRAQEPATRAEALERQRERKAEELKPYQSSRLERFLYSLENDRLLERILNPAEGLYPKLGSLTPGSGFSFGPAYRRPGLLAGHADFSTFAAVSFRRYWLLEARLALPRLADGRAFVEVAAQRYDYPSEDFFGLGADSDRGSHTTFGLHGTALSGSAGLRPRDWLTFGGRLEYTNPRVSGGADQRSIETLFTPATAPGLDAQPDYLRYDAVAEVNYRQPRGNPRRGGRYALLLQRYDDRTFDRYSFNRIEADLQQYFPLVNERRVIALHGFASMSDALPGRQVPFYMQRTLGGPDDLRGFRRFRFRDENLILFQAEYRWEIFTAVDGAIFYDAGKVASSASELTLDDLESDFGIGFRFGTVNGVFLRVEGAFGSAAGKHFVLRYGHVF